MIDVILAVAVSVLVMLAGVSDLLFLLWCEAHPTTAADKHVPIP